MKLLSVRKKKKHASEESVSLSSEENEVQTDPYEKILIYDEEKDQYFIKFKNKSYLHCEWVSSAEIKSTGTGAIKIKRYKPCGFNNDYIIVDRVLGESYEDGEQYVLIKWKNLPHELSTYESIKDAEKCEGYPEELVKYRDRKKMRHMKMALDWRPQREDQIKYDKSPEYANDNSLRSYQLEGLNWLLNRWYYKQSCIMADEMGLGKTVQSVAFVNALFNAFEYTAPALIIAPLSTIGHWERTFANWTSLRVLKYHGSIQGRQVIANHEFCIKAGNISVRLFDVLITTYEMAMAGSDHLSQFEYGVGIYDEAHRLKNPNSKAAICLRGFSVQHKVLLSGTPIQNNLNELWALFNFIDPLRFNNLSDFQQEFQMNKAEDVEKLQAVLKPLMLRRMKEDVETTIPTKEETIIEVELTMTQKRYYRAILEKNLEFLTKGDRSNAPNLINAMMELRKCCIHPYLLNGAEEKILGDYLRKKEKTAGEVNINGFYFETIDEYYRILIQSSGKLVLLDKLLAKLQGQHKVLIFSQMTKCLDLLSEYLAYRKYSHERIDGGVKGELRQAAIDRFSTGDTFVFLLCTRAGGVGINLTAADTVIIFDSDWNPQNDLQAQARCHRIGQTNEVKIYRLVTRNSYEREMFDKAGLKLGLDKAILQKMGFDNQPTDAMDNAPVKKEDAIQLLLRKGAYGVLMETDDASQNFCEEDIDQILERRTEVIKHSDGGNAFSKATFQVEEDLEEPDFWETLLSQKKNEEMEGRVKRQCRRLSREGVLSESDRLILAELHESHGNFTVAEHSSDREIMFLQLFITVLIKGPFTTKIDVLNGNPSDPNFLILSQLVKYCLDLISVSKIKADFSAYIENIRSDYDPNDFLRFADTYLRYHEQFLFRIQVPVLLDSLLKVEDLNVDRIRGWTLEDDKTIVRELFSKGYDCFTVKEKQMEETNKRVRRIITVLSHRKEIRDNDSMIFKAILNYGRLTDINEYNVGKFLKQDVNKFNEIVDRIWGMSRRSRKDTPEADCYERINFFDRLMTLSRIPEVKRIPGLPKRWDAKRDMELKKHLLESGFGGVQEKFGMSEDVVVKRFDAIYRAANLVERE